MSETIIILLIAIIAILGFLTFITTTFIVMWVLKQWGNHGVETTKIQADLNNWNKELQLINNDLNKPDLRMTERTKLEEEKAIAEKAIAKLQKALRNKTF